MGPIQSRQILFTLSRAASGPWLLNWRTLLYARVLPCDVGRPWLGLFRVVCPLGLWTGLYRRRRRRRRMSDSVLSCNHLFESRRVHHQRLRRVLLRHPLFPLRGPARILDAIDYAISLRQRTFNLPNDQRRTFDNGNVVSRLLSSALDLLKFANQTTSCDILSPRCDLQDIEPMLLCRPDILRVLVDRALLVEQHPRGVAHRVVCRQGYRATGISPSNLKLGQYPDWANTWNGHTLQAGHGLSGVSVYWRLADHPDSLSRANLAAA